MISFALFLVIKLHSSQVTKMTILFKLAFLSLGIFINHIHGLAPSEEIGGKHYTFHNDLKRQSEASSACKNEGGKLYEAKEENVTVYYEVLNFALENGLTTNIWLGIVDISKGGQFVYQSDNVPISWNEWADGEPRRNYASEANQKPSEDCVSVNESGWYNQNCGNPYQYMCERNGQGKPYKPGLIQTLSVIEFLISPNINFRSIKVQLWYYCHHFNFHNFPNHIGDCIIHLFTKILQKVSTFLTY